MALGDSRVSLFWFGLVSDDSEVVGGSWRGGHGEDSSVSYGRRRT